MSCQLTIGIILKSIGYSAACICNSNSASAVIKVVSLKVTACFLTNQTQAINILSNRIVLSLNKKLRKPCVDVVNELGCIFTLLGLYPCSLNVVGVVSCSCYCQPVGRIVNCRLEARNLQTSSRISVFRFLKTNLTYNLVLLFI